MDIKDNINHQGQVELTMADVVKKQYVSPQLEDLGSLVKVTMGGSNITNDSGQGPGSGPNP